ncbi:hypothetical protein WA171_006049 [Blastocystis sp. BT1]
MNPNTMNTGFKLPSQGLPKQNKGPGRYTHMYNDIQQLLDLGTFGSSLIMMLASSHKNFLVNHRFTMDGERPRYSFLCQYKTDKVQLNSTWVLQPGVKATVKWTPNDNFCQEASAIVSILRQQDNSLFKAIVGRSVYQDADSCTELVLDNQSGLALYYNQAISNKYTVGIEAYYDFLSNKNIHVGVSGMYRDQLRKCVATFTSNYTLYMYYLRMVNKNVSLVAGCNIAKMNSPSEMRASTVIGCDFNLPRTKAHLQTTIDMTGSVKTIMREQLTSNAQIAFSGEFNPIYDDYRFGMSFIYGTAVDKNYGFTPLSGQQQ